MPGPSRQPSPCIGLCQSGRLILQCALQLPSSTDLGRDKAVVEHSRPVRGSNVVPAQNWYQACTPRTGRFDVLLLLVFGPTASSLVEVGRSGLRERPSSRRVSG